MFEWFKLSTLSSKSVEYNIFKSSNMPSGNMKIKLYVLLAIFSQAAAISLRTNANNDSDQKEIVVQKKISAESFALPLNGLIAFLYYSMLPAFYSILNAFNVRPDFSSICKYDVQLANRVMFGPLFAMVLHIFAFTFFDLVLTFTKRQDLKRQGKKAFVSLNEWLKVFIVSFFNLGIMNWFVILAGMQVTQYLHGDSLMKAADPWLFYIEIPKLLLCVVALELYGYFVHRGMHHPLVYGSLHKWHHEYKAPVAAANLYENPIEFMFNAAGLALGPFLFNVHPATMLFWFVFSRVGSVGAHSGYVLFGCLEHDIHHERFNYNYGPVGFMDPIMGTDWKERKEVKMD